MQILLFNCPLGQAKCQIHKRGKHMFRTTNYRYLKRLLYLLSTAVIGLGVMALIPMMGSHANLNNTFKSLVSIAHAQDTQQPNIEMNKKITPRKQNNDIAFKKLELKNGLTVFLLPDTRLPLVSIHLWVNVGSRDEDIGRSGFAHLFEHLMFMGTRAVPNIDQILAQGGASNNAQTRDEVTLYHTTGPAHMLETMLYLEADRFTNLAQDMTIEKLEKQRSVVLNERRQNYVNTPYGGVWLMVPKLIYPQKHPLAHATIGSEADIQNATIDDVREFFNKYYVPNNITLVISGDFDTTDVISMLDRTVARIPSAQPAPHKEVSQVREIKHAFATFFDKVTSPRLYFIWHSPAYRTSGDAELDIFSRLLCAGKSGILYRRLVDEKKLASTISCGQHSGKNSIFLIVAQPTEPTIEGTQKLKQAIEEELHKTIRTSLQYAQNNENRDKNENNDFVIDQKTFERAKIKFEMAVLKQIESVEGKAEFFSEMYFYSGETQLPSAELNRYANANLNTLLETLKTIFENENQQLTLTVFPKEFEKTHADSLQEYMKLDSKP